MDIKARKAEINLKTLGSGVIFFGAWAFIKYALTFLIYGFELDEAVDDIVLLVSTIIVWVFLALAFLIRLYIGISARAESEGKRRHAFYLILTGVITFIDAAAILLELVLLVTKLDDMLNMAVTILIDVTSTVILIELMVNAVTVRKMKKKEAAV